MMKKISAAGALVVFVLGLASTAHAQSNPVTDGFGTASAALLGYVALGVAMVVAMLLAGIGVRVLIKWTRRAASAS